MLSTLVVTIPASTLTLLTQDEMRSAADTTTDDAALAKLEARVAASIMSECNIAVGIGGEPTLKQETLTETFWQVETDNLLLARRHNVSITGVTVDGGSISASDYLLDPDAGMLMRLSSDAPIRWCARKIVVVYKAGFTTIPGDLKQAAMDFLSAAYREMGRDPFVKSEEVDIPDVERIRRDYWVGSIPGQSNEGAVPDIVAGQLKRFRNLAVG